MRLMSEVILTEQGAYAAMADSIAVPVRPDQVPQNVAGTTSSVDGGDCSHGEASGG